MDRFETPKRPLPYAHSRTHSHAHSLPIGAAELKLPNVSSKGKQKDTEDFHFGWWDFVPLLEPRRPPVQWTSSSLIITAHPSEPRVACLHFPSNKQFTLPSPPSISTSPASYEPPTIISASARDNWVFAYFPGIDVDGVGCFWNKTRMVDDWNVKEWRTFARGDGAIAARWLNPEREWTSSDSGTPTRLPALGPYLPLSNPVLLVVTETRLCNVYYLQPQTEQILMLSALLSRRSSSKEGQERPSGERVDGPRGIGRCLHAAIGLGYDESSVLISMYSSFVPSAVTESGLSNSTNINLSLSMPTPDEPVITSDWETWRDENVIEICEVNISVQGFLLSLTTTPLPLIRDFSQPGRCLTSMTFVPSLPSLSIPSGVPSTPTQTHRRVTPQSSPASVPAHVSQSPGRTLLRSPVKGAPPKPVLEKAKGKLLGVLHLLCTSLELGQYTSTPKSDIVLYTFWRNPMDIQTWYFKRASQLALPASVVMHVSPSQPTSPIHHTTALLGILNSEGHVIKRNREQQLSVGKLRVLRLPELQFDEEYEPVNIVCTISSCGVELPFSLAVSPNRTLACTVPSTSLLSFNMKTPTYIHSHPVRTPIVSSDPGLQRTRKQLSALLEIASQRRITPSDVVHFLCAPNISTSTVEEVLASMVLDFDTANHNMANMWAIEVVGIAVEVLRIRSQSAKRESDVDDLSSRYRTGVEICSLSACNKIWEDTSDNDGYDPNAVWHLTSLSIYFMEEFIEKLLKECVRFAGNDNLSEHPIGPDASPKIANPSDLVGKGDAEPPVAVEQQKAQASTLRLSSSLLYFIHPYALDILHTFLRHVKRFRAYLGSSKSVDERHQVARELLMDAVDSSPVDIEALIKVLSEIKSDVKANAEHSLELSRRCLASLKPPPQYTPLLQKIISKIMQEQVVDKLQLFIKPADLVDGILGLSMNSEKTHCRDVITKGYLPGQSHPVLCLRCGGKSEIATKLNTPSVHTSIRWTAWEKTWQTHCICGGLWSSKT